MIKGLTTAIEFLKRERVFALSAFLCVCGFYFFVKLSSEVLEGESLYIDKKLLLMLRDPSNPQNLFGPLWFHEVMRDLTALGGFAILTVVTIAVVIYFFIRKEYGQGFYVMGAVGTGIVLSNLLKIGFDRPRPDLVPHGSITYLSSFPSGHSMMAAIVYFTLGALLARGQEALRLKLYIICFVAFLTFITGVSRVYLGVHWPSDVIAGWLAGFSWAMLMWLVNEKIQSRFWNV